MDDRKTIKRLGKIQILKNTALVNKGLLEGDANDANQTGALQFSWGGDIIYYYLTHDCTTTNCTQYSSSAVTTGLFGVILVKDQIFFSLIPYIV